MMALLRPTLARRVTLALLLAFALVWVVLMARQLYAATDGMAIERNLQSLGDSMLASIAPLADAGEARAVVAATATMINDGYRSRQVPGAVLVELRAADGTRLFYSPEGGHSRMRGELGRISKGSANGQHFRLYKGSSARWSLTVALPELSFWWMAQSMMGGLTIDMLIAFPLVLLPIWLAVKRGLQPLRELSTRIAARGPDDLGALGYAASYAELLPLTAALDSLLGQLRDQRAREHGFVQDAAHELRTPLAVISAQAHVLVMAADDAERAHAERHMDRAVARASHLVGQLLTLAQMDKQQAPAASEQDVAALLRRELALLAPAVIARGIELSLEAPDTLPNRIEVHAFVSIIHNLINNALAYVPRHGQVRVALAARNGGLSLSVADDGPGIAPAQRSLVFERFHRGAGHDSAGAGLGLAIVREAAARLQGRVILDDGIDGKGCTFTVYIAAR